MGDKGRIKELEDKVNTILAALGGGDYFPVSENQRFLAMGTWLTNRITAIAEGEVKKGLEKRPTPIKEVMDGHYLPKIRKEVDAAIDAAATLHEEAYHCAHEWQGNLHGWTERPLVIPLEDRACYAKALKDLAKALMPEEA